MLDRIKNGFNLLNNMGWRYTKFRMQHEFLNKTGLLKNKFPAIPLTGNILALINGKITMPISFLTVKNFYRL